VVVARILLPTESNLTVNMYNWLNQCTGCIVNMYMYTWEFTTAEDEANFKTTIETAECLKFECPFCVQAADQVCRKPLEISFHTYDFSNVLDDCARLGMIIYENT